MKNNLVLVDRQHPKITIATLNRPEKRNALSLDLIKELHKIFKDTESIKKQRVFIIRGSGDAFSTGMDLQESSNPLLSEEVVQHLASLYLDLSNSSLVTVSAIHGMTLAGGAGIALASDFIIADKDSLIGFPEVRRGLVPALVMAMLRRQLPEPILKELFLLGEPIRAERAHALNLVYKLVERDNLLKESLSTASTIIRGSPSAQIRTKRLLQELNPKSLETDIEHALICHKQVRAHADAKEGIQAFLEHREPRWENL
jgi:methylglutaconyl-CoA hydratase